MSSLSIFFLCCCCDDGGGGVSSVYTTFSIRVYFQMPGNVLLFPGMWKCTLILFPGLWNFFKIFGHCFNVVIQILIYTSISLNDLQKVHLVSKAEAHLLILKEKERRDHENKDGRPQSQLRCMSVVRWASGLCYLGIVI